MKPTLYLRIASIVTFIHAVLHTIGGVFGKPPPGASATAFAAMQSNHFMAMGAWRSYADFYLGLGLGVTISLTVEAIVLWQLGTLAKTDAARLRPIIAAFLISFLVFALISYRYFFFGPVVTEVLIAACLGMAFVTAKTSEVRILSRA